MNRPNSSKFGLWRRLAAGLLAVMCCGALFGCGTEEVVDPVSDSASTPTDAVSQDDTAETESETQAPTESAMPLRDDAQYFETYVSNTVVATGNNIIVEEADHITYRAWLPVECAGVFSYCFYFSNTVDSTWEDGSLSYAGMSGGSYTIESASVSDGGSEFDANVVPATTVPVTFDGSETKAVSPGETFWSDPVELDIPQGHYLLWEWTLTGENIPAINMSNMAYSYADKGDGKGFLYAGQVPLPQMFGCDREVETRIVTLGDSITQGSLTSEFSCRFWASQTLDLLGTESYSLWNLGLGYSRATDCALEGDWLSRAVAGADLITVAFATNDLTSGAYGAGAASTPEEIQAAVTRITSRCTEAGIDTILFNAPPFDLNDECEQSRIAYNALVPDIAASCGAVYFDMASLLEDPSDPSATIYGQHPNDEGGTVIATALVETIQEMQRSAAQ